MTEVHSPQGVRGSDPSSPVAPSPGARGSEAVDAVDELSPRAQEIVETAARLFSSMGYHHTGMDDIAHACGLKKPSLYHYFRSKDELVYLIHEVVYRQINGALERRIAEGQGPRACLLGAMTDIMQVMDEREGYLRVFFEHHPELPAERFADARRKRDAYADRVRDLVAQVMLDEGKERDHVDQAAPIATLALFGMCNWSYQWYEPDGRLNAHQIASYFYEIWLKGVLHSGAPNWLEKEGSAVEVAAG